MIRPKSPMRRAIAIAAGALIGAAGVMAFAAPASAHHPEIYGKYCLVKGSNNYEFTWTVYNSETIPGTITKVLPGAVGAIQVGATLPAKGDPSAPLSGTETRTAANSQALAKNLTVEAQWKRDKRIITEERTVKAVDKGFCKKTPPTTPPTTAPPTTPPATEPPTTPPTTAPPTTPPATQTPEPTPSATPEPVEPVGTYEFTCDEVIITVENPTDETVSIVLTPNEGEAQTLTVEPGKTGSVTFPAKEGLVITPSGDGIDGDPLAYEKPEDCTPGGGGGEGDLPLTGAAAGGIAAGAVLLLGAGVVLYIVARRRRVTFTA
ncbi:cell wall anchor protein [Plantactinospora sp. B24E8]|uniref:cell wall anchor protein n=1 Tax=Plantactinospora sp. B24E8 TaxID=3153567 RepID=UPI00325F1AD0